VANVSIHPFPWERRRKEERKSHFLKCRGRVQLASASVRCNESSTFVNKEKTKEEAREADIFLFLLDTFYFHSRRDGDDAAAAVAIREKKAIGMARQE
jgi:hypothetical protein